MIDPAALRRRLPPIDRSSDRQVALGAIAFAAAPPSDARLRMAAVGAVALGAAAVSVGVVGDDRQCRP